MNTLKKFLVVDDDPVVAKSFDRVLSGRGYVVVTAKDGPEALRKIAAEKYDVVYTDIRMPGMDGIAVAEHIKKSQPWLPVVIVSGYATTENEARARAAGVSAVLHKPLSPQMIEDSAREALFQSVDAAMPTWTPESAAPAVNHAPPTGVTSFTDLAKGAGLVFGAPLLGLAFVLALPFAGLAMIIGFPVWYGGKALIRRVGGIRTWGRNVALFLAAPFLGLAYALAMPFVMGGMIAWMGVRALLKRAEAH